MRAASYFVNVMRSTRGGNPFDPVAVREEALRCRAWLAAELDRPEVGSHELRLDQAEVEIDNLRLAFAWSRENAHAAEALTLASALQPLWLARGHIREGVRWLETALSDSDADTLRAHRARALADKAIIEPFVFAGNAEHAEEALVIARGLEDPALVARALTANGCIRGHNAEDAQPYFAEALLHANVVNDAWLVSRILGWQAYGAMMMGNPRAALAAAEEGLRFADSIGDGFVSRQCRWCLGLAQMFRGDLCGALDSLESTAREADAAHDLMWLGMARSSQGWALAFLGRDGKSLNRALYFGQCVNHRFGAFDAQQFGEMFLGFLKFVGNKLQGQGSFVGRQLTASRFRLFGCYYRFIENLFVSEVRPGVRFACELVGNR